MATFDRDPTPMTPEARLVEAMLRSLEGEAVGDADGFGPRMDAAAADTEALSNRLRLNETLRLSLAASAFGEAPDGDVEVIEVARCGPDAFGVTLSSALPMGPGLRTVLVDCQAHAIV